MQQAQLQIIQFNLEGKNMKKLILTLLLIMTSSAFSMEEPPTKKSKGFLSPITNAIQNILNYNKNQKELEILKQKLAINHLWMAETANEVQEAIKAGADINKKNDKGYTPLNFLLICSRREAAKFLINEGVDIHAKNNDGRTAVSCALDGVLPDIACLLIKKGVEVNFSTLSSAVYHDEIEIVKTILDHGMNVNHQNEHGTTALMNAIRYGGGNFEMVKTLIYRGAKVDIKDNKGETALDFAKESNNKEILEFLENYLEIKKTMINILDQTERPYFKNKIIESTDLNKDVSGVISDYWSSNS